MKLALISDVHGNLEAFNAVLEEIKRRKIKKIFCLGDIVDYGANPEECIKIIIKNKIVSVQGNHDLNVVTLENYDWFNESSKASLKIITKILNKKEKDFLLKLPKTIKHENMFLVHASPRDYLYEYVYPDTPDSLLEEFFNIAKKKIIIMGHTHIPFVKILRSNRLVINPGSIGQPRDKNNKASFCILDNKKLDAKIIRIEYDIDKAAEKILELGMPKFLAERLYQGI